MLTEIENILNSRPLTHVSVDSDDSEPLTPNHFLIGPYYTAMPCSTQDKEHLNLLSKWRSAEKLADHFGKSGQKNTYRILGKEIN